jgi:glycine hydroxymethyltransferase
MHPAIDSTLRAVDPEIADLIKGEERRQRDKIRLIASENYVSSAVLAATGSVLTNKYSEGYPGKRYYEGQQFIDPVETLCIDRAKALFGADHANVQPYSGSPANLAVYFAFLKPGDTVMGLGLPAGGHLTHGWNVSITGSYFRAVQYGVERETGLVDMNKVRELALKERPKLLIAGGTAVPRTIDFAAYAAIDRAVFPGLQGGPHNHTTAAIAVSLKEAATAEFKTYAAQIVANARALAAAMVERGFSLVTGGTDNHLILADLTSKNIPGKVAAKALDEAGIVLNYNSVPFDTRKPFDPSGIRIGSAAVTSRGFREAEMVKIADWMDQVVRAPDSADLKKRIAGEVAELCKGFPAPGIVVD